MERFGSSFKEGLAITLQARCRLRWTRVQLDTGCLLFTHTYTAYRCTYTPQKPNIKPNCLEVSDNFDIFYSLTQTRLIFSHFFLRVCVCVCEHVAGMPDSQRRSQLRLNRLFVCLSSLVCHIGYFSPHFHSAQYTLTSMHKHREWEGEPESLATQREYWLSEAGGSYVPVIPCPSLGPCTHNGAVFIRNQHFSTYISMNTFQQCCKYALLSQVLFHHLSTIYLF